MENYTSLWCLVMRETRSDELVGDLREDEYAIMPTAKDETIAWVLWHISRIEDLTMNILVNGEKQIFNEDWQTRMNSPIRDTGNALSDNQIIQLSKSLRIQELLEYRNEVGRKKQRNHPNLISR